MRMNALHQLNVVLPVIVPGVQAWLAMMASSTGNIHGWDGSLN
jgi:hypothetical protein